MKGKEPFFYNYLKALHYKQYSSKHEDLTNCGVQTDYKFSVFVTGAHILQVLNSDSQAFAKEFGGPILDYAIDYAMNVTQRFFDAYTYDQLSHVPLTEDFFEKE